MVNASMLSTEKSPSAPSLTAESSGFPRGRREGTEVHAPGLPWEVFATHQPTHLSHAARPGKSGWATSFLGGPGGQLKGLPLLGTHEKWDAAVAPPVWSRATDAALEKEATGWSPRPPPSPGLLGSPLGRLRSGESQRLGRERGCQWGPRRWLHNDQNRPCPPLPAPA